MKKQLKFILNILFIVIVSIFVYGAILKSNTKEILIMLSQMNYQYVFLAFLFILIWMSIISIILRNFTKLFKSDYCFKEALLNSLIASLFHGITPSSSGGQVAQVYVFSKQNVNEASASSILLLEFIVYQLALCFVSFVFLLFGFKYYFNQFNELYIFIIVGFLINLSIVLFLYLLMKSKRFHDFLIKAMLYLGKRFKILKNIEKKRLDFEQFFIRFRSDILFLKRQRKLLIVNFGLNILRLICLYSIPFCLFLASGQGFSIEFYINSLALSSFVAMVSGMIPLPGASGGVEVLFIMMFNHLYEALSVKTIVIIWRFLTYYFVMFIGFLAFIYIKIRYRSLE